VLLAMCTFSRSLRSQQVEAAAGISYEGQRVSSVQLAGQPDGDLPRLRAVIAQPINAPYSQAQIDQTVAALTQPGHVKGVEVQVEPEADGLHVIFVLQPAFYFGVFNFTQAEKKFSYTRLLQTANYSRQEPFTHEKVDEAESSLLDFFHRTGYFLATVEPRLQTDVALGVVNVAFDINLNRRAKFGDVTITGVSGAQNKRLADSLRSFRARLKGALLKPGKSFSQKRLTAATAYLQHQLGKQQYLAAKVRVFSTKYNPTTNRADIAFAVTEGPRIEIQVEGAHLWERTKKRLIPMYQESAVDADLVNEGAQDLTSYFQSKGYFAARVRSRLEKHSSGMTVLYLVDKGKRGRVESVEFHGNQHFSDKDLKSRVPVAKAARFMPFSHGKYSEQLLRKSIRNIEGVYRTSGYSQVKVTPAVVRHGGNVQLAFQVEEGVRDVVESLQIEGNRSLSRKELAPQGMRMEPGKPYSADLLNKDRDQIIASYLDRGFLNMTFKATVSHLKDDPRRVQVLYQIEEGIQSFTVSVDPVGAVHTRPEIIVRNANIKVGRPLSETALLRGESQLYTLGIFDWASVDTRRVPGQSQAQVLVALHESKRNSVAYGFGFQVINRGGSIPSGTIALPGLPPVGLPKKFTTSQETFWGPEGSIEYTRRNFRGRAETVTLAAFAGRLDQRGSASWSNPTFWNSGWSSTVTLSGERTSENPIFTARLGGLGVQFQHYLDRNRQKQVILRYDFRRTSLSNIVIPDLVLPEDQNVRLSFVSGSFIRDTRDNLLDAHRGILESFEINLNPSFFGTNTSFGRILLQTSYYRPLTSDSAVVWANGVRLGMEHAFGGEHIPISERFFSGGGSTLRGFSLNGAGPQRTVSVCPVDNASCGEVISVPLGGQQFFIFNTELRFPTGISLPLVGGSLGGAVFYDGGNVYNSVGLGQIFSDFTHTVGFGLRYKTPIGPVRLDIGHLLNAPPGVKTWQFFVTLGQAF